MSEFKVSKERIEIFPHPNADSLQLGRVGTYQVVVKEGLYNDGDEVVFAPEKSILSGQIKEEFQNYLVGTNKDRVKAIRLRGEISAGIIIPRDLVPNFDDLEVGVDIGDQLGISKWEPPIPTQLMGKASGFSMPYIGSHDCAQAGVYINELISGERIVITEKVHGSQLIYACNLENDEELVSSKGLLKSQLKIEESPDNTYWKAVRNDKLFDMVKASFDSGVVQIFGEVIPVQKGYNYGQTEPTVRLFDIRHNGVSIPYDQVAECFKVFWVPVIYDGPANLIVKVTNYPSNSVKEDKLLPKEIVDLCQGNELVSGKEVHIREGVVLRPYIDRLARDRTKLRLKIINPKYKETGEEFN